MHACMTHKKQSCMPGREEGRLTMVVVSEARPEYCLCFQQHMCLRCAHLVLRGNAAVGHHVWLPLTNASLCCRSRARRCCARCSSRRRPSASCWNAIPTSRRGGGPRCSTRSATRRSTERPRGRAVPRRGLSSLGGKIRLPSPACESCDAVTHALSLVSYTTPLSPPNPRNVRHC